MRLVWREHQRDAFGLSTGALRSRQESYPTREAAEARRDELDAAKHTSGTGVLADAKKAGELPFGYYARACLDAQGLKVAQGKLKQRTVGLPTFERRDIWERPYSRTAGGCTDV